MSNNRFLPHAGPGIAGLNPYVPGKPVEELERELGILESIKLASNENPLGPSPLAWAAVQQAAGDLHLYPDDTAYRLRHKLAELHGVNDKQIILGNGSSDVLDMVARSFLAPGVNAVYAAHSFAMYAIYTQAKGAEGRVAAPLGADHSRHPYGHDLDSLLDGIDERTRVVFIANPNNPTGTWVPRDDLAEFVQRVPEHVIVVLDEAYTQYVEEPDFPDGTTLIADHPNLLVTRTFSKIFGLAGLRVGYGVGSAELVSMVSRVRHPFNVNMLALAAAEAALGDEDFIKRSVEVNRDGLKQLKTGFAELDLGHIPSVGNFVCVELDRPGAEVYEALLREGVIVRPVANYQLPNHLRVTVGTESDNARLLEAMKKVLGR